MTKDFEAILEHGSPRVPQEQAPSRKPYDSPCLQEWGSILELTGGPLAEDQDADFGGSVPV
jgi:hypothetical protein